MMDEGLHEIHQSEVEKIEITFYCCLAALCFCLGIYYWIRLIGVFPAENWRFDLMGWPWRALSTGLAVLYPVSACGLWLQSRWGLILWIVGALIESGCYLFASFWFGFNLWLPFLHLVFFGSCGSLYFYRYRLAHTEDEADFTVEY